MTRICGIYKITSPSGKIYIGQSTDIKSRKKHYKYSIKPNQRHLYNSITKYGWDAHKFEIVEECIPEKLNDLEVYYIKFFNSFESENGMNCTSGGLAGGKQCAETKKIKSIACKAAWSNPELIEKQRQRGLMCWTDEKRKAHADITFAFFTKEKRDQFSKMYTGDGNPFYGKKHSDDTKKRISHKKRGTPSPFKDRKRPNLAGANNKKSKAVLQFDLNGVFISEYPCINEASALTKISRLSIRNSCNNKTKSPRKFIFKYKKVK